MAHLVQAFPTFRDASDFARHLATQRDVELRVKRVDSEWHVTSELPLEIGTFNQLEAQLQEREMQTQALRDQLAELQQKLQEVAAEKERFRLRVIKHETKSAWEVAGELSRTHDRRPLPEPKCEACGCTLTFCRCAR